MMNKSLRLATVTPEQFLAPVSGNATTASHPESKFGSLS